MKKIGVLTFHNPINYGGILQAYALQTFLKKNNFDCEIINYNSMHIKRSNSLIFNQGKKTSTKTIIKNLITIIPNVVRKKNYNKFIRRNLYLSERIEKKDFVSYCNNNYESIIVGSDQVWNVDITKDEKDIYFLKNIQCNKNSYAASAGTDSKENIDAILNNTKKFNNISIREESTCKILRDKGVNVEQNVDPVILLKSEEWSKFSYNIKDKNKSGYILLYILEENKNIKKIAEKIKDIYKIDKIKTFSKKKYGIKKIKSIGTSGPKEFLNAFYNSKVVLTNSFHGTVFSIIFKKDFYVLLPNKRSERIVSILRLFGLENRIVSNINDISRIYLEGIDYENVDKMLQAERSKTLKYLKKLEISYEKKINKK